MCKEPRCLQWGAPVLCPPSFGVTSAHLQPQSRALVVPTRFFFHSHVPQLARQCSSRRVRLFVLFAVK